jgi:UDP-glucuronate decarboxylase
MASAPEVTGPINLGNPIEMNMLELAQRVIALSGSRSRIVHQPLPVDDPTQRRPDISRASSVLGWTPQVGVDDGLQRTIAYFDRLLGQGAGRPDAGPSA